MILDLIFRADINIIPLDCPPIQLCRPLPGEQAADDGGEDEAKI